MKRLLLISLTSALLFSCNKNDKGELVGIKTKKWFPEKPYGMTLVPGGAFTMGKASEDLAGVQDAPLKTVTVRSFYMDETEITNSEYRQFVYDVRDSIVRFKLAVLADEMGFTDPKVNPIAQYAFTDVDTTDLSVYEKYRLKNYGGMGPTGYEGRKINKRIDLIWNTDDYPDEYYAEVMDSIFLKDEDVYNGRRTVDWDKIKYEFTWIDIEAAAKTNGKRSDFVQREIIEVYPDTTVWIKDFNYSYNEPMHNDYFWHDAYSDYPVVGVTWKQAKAFAVWRTNYKNAYQSQRRLPLVSAFRLPTEAEWEYAARGGLESAAYPWGGPYTKNDRNCFYANFKPLRGDYAADDALYTVEAKSYKPNDYNLYNMSGNVSEWTDSSYDPTSYNVMSSMNPNTTDQNNPKKVIRGGSWKDVAYFLQVSTRDYEYADSARSYIGFRTVQDYNGGSTNAFGPQTRMRKKGK
ncbi:MAG: gliding motility lipoprotein GldK [Bacteroidetes bacterium]|nr:gliding motility lipoprotein GldK [Bacteroidota bacterium]